MAETVVNLVLLVFFCLAVIFCLLAPVATLGFVFWQWRRESIDLLKPHLKPGRRNTLLHRNVP